MFYTMSGEHTLRGITLRQFVTGDDEADFNLEALQSTFGTIVKDYDQDLPDDKSIAFEFCWRVLFEIGPDSRQYGPTKNKSWIFKLMKPVDDGKNMAAYIIKIVHMKDPDNPVCRESELIMNVDQAELLASKTLCKIIPLSLCLPTPRILLIPRAVTFFERDRISSMADDWGLTKAEMLQRVNESTLSGGHHLPYGDPNIAIWVTVLDAQNIRDNSVRNSTIARTIKRYISRDKKPDQKHLDIVGAYIKGGLSHYFKVRDIISLMDTVQKS